MNRLEERLSRIEAMLEQLIRLQQPDEVLTTAQAAALAGVHRATITKAIKAGELIASRPGNRNYRISKRELMRWVNDRRVDRQRRAQMRAAARKAAQVQKVKQLEEARR